MKIQKDFDKYAAKVYKCAYVNENGSCMNIQLLLEL